MKKYRTICTLAFQEMLQYRMSFVLNYLMSIFSLIAPFVLWLAIFNQQSEIAGYDRISMVTYLVITSIAQKLLIQSGIENNISFDIREGVLTQYIIKPMNYLRYRIASFFSKKVAETVILVIPFLLIAVLMSFLGLYTLDLTLESVLQAIATGILACIMSSLLYSLLGIIAFWMLDCSSLYIAFGTIIHFLSGGLFPLDVFTNLTWLFNILPFQYQLYIPVKVLMGSVSIPFIQIVVVQLAWIVILQVLLTLLWRKGLIKYTSVGA